jgi:glutathione S-transferase
MIVLHGVSASPFVRKVLAVLAIKGIEFKQLPQMPFADDAEFKKISPLGKIPAIQDGELTICDSHVICEYLEEAYPNLPLYPSTAALKAKARWYEELGDNSIAELASGIFFQRFMRPMAFKQDPDEELVAKIITRKLPPILDYLEAEVPTEGFLFGPSLMIADLALISSFINAGYAGYEVDAAKWPKVSGFIGRVKSHDAIAPLLAAEAEMLGLKS